MALNREIAARLADERMAEWRRRGQEDWRRLVGDKELRQVVAEDGKRYGVASHALDDGDGCIRMVVAVDDGGWSALSPLCRDEIMRPDGSLFD